MLSLKVEDGYQRLDEKSQFVEDMSPAREATNQEMKEMGQRAKNV